MITRPWVRARRAVAAQHPSVVFVARPRRHCQHRSTSGRRASGREPHSRPHAPREGLPPHAEREAYYIGVSPTWGRDTSGSRPDARPSDSSSTHKGPLPPFLAAGGGDCPPASGPRAFSGGPAPPPPPN